MGGERFDFFGAQSGDLSAYLTTSSAKFVPIPGHPAYKMSEGNDPSLCCPPSFPEFNVPPPPEPWIYLHPPPHFRLPTCPLAWPGVVSSPNSGSGLMDQVSPSLAFLISALIAFVLFGAGAVIVVVYFRRKRNRKDIPDKPSTDGNHAVDWTFNSMTLGNAGLREINLNVESVTSDSEWETPVPSTIYDEAPSDKLGHTSNAKSLYAPGMTPLCHSAIPSSRTFHSIHGIQCEVPTLPRGALIYCHSPNPNCLHYFDNGKPDVAVTYVIDQLNHPADSTPVYEEIASQTYCDPNFSDNSFNLEQILGQTLSRCHRTVGGDSIYKHDDYHNDCKAVHPISERGLDNKRGQSVSISPRSSSCDCESCKNSDKIGHISGDSGHSLESFDSDQTVPIKANCNQSITGSSCHCRNSLLQIVQCSERSHQLPTHLHNHSKIPNHTFDQDSMISLRCVNTGEVDIPKHSFHSSVCIAKLNNENDTVTIDPPNRQFSPATIDIALVNGPNLELCPNLKVGLQSLPEDISNGCCENCCPQNERSESGYGTEGQLAGPQFGTAVRDSREAGLNSWEASPVNFNKKCASKPEYPRSGRLESQNIKFSPSTIKPHDLRSFTFRDGETVRTNLYNSPHSYRCGHHSANQRSPNCCDNQFSPQSHASGPILGQLSAEGPSPTNDDQDSKPPKYCFNSKNANKTSPLQTVIVSHDGVIANAPTIPLVVYSTETSQKSHVKSAYV